MPCDEPGSSVHSAPLQQSALVVQAAPVTTHPEPQTKPNSLPGVGTHGLPQQSALDEQLMPGVNVHAPPLSAPQRGMPRLS